MREGREVVVVLDHRAPPSCVQVRKGWHQMEGGTLCSRVMTRQWWLPSRISSEGGLVEVMVTKGMWLGQKVSGGDKRYLVVTKEGYLAFEQGRDCGWWALGSWWWQTSLLL